MGEKRVEVDPNLLAVIQNSIIAGVNEGLKRAMVEYDKEKKANYKMKYDKRLRNTGLLLKNYRNFKEHCKYAIYDDIQEVKNNIEESTSIVEILDKMYDIKDEATIVQSILKAKERTLIIIRHIDTCIDFYEYKASNSTNIEYQRRVEVIKRLYINDEIETFEDIAKDLYISTKTVNRDRKKATEELAPLIFGADGIIMS